VGLDVKFNLFPMEVTGIIKFFCYGIRKKLEADGWELELTIVDQILTLDTISEKDMKRR